MRIARCVCGALMVIALTTAAVAHHSASAEYDVTKTVAVDGTVTQFKFANPHSILTIEVTDSERRAVKWTVEFSSSVFLAEHGWNAATFKPGERLTVAGNPARSGVPRIYFRNLTFADGRQLVAPAAANLDEVDRARRTRTPNP